MTRYESSGEYMYKQNVEKHVPYNWLSTKIVLSNGVYKI